MKIWKICPECNQSKELSEFHKDKHRKDGRAQYCKPCKIARTLVKKPTPEGLARSHKRCSWCYETKLRAEFNKSSSSSDGMQSLCKACIAIEYQQRWETGNKRIYNWLCDLKERYQCIDCDPQVVHPYWRLEFDHVRGSKVDTIAHMVRNSKYTKEDIEDEVAKCEVVCANHHKDRTHKRLLSASRGRKTIEESPATLGLATNS